MGDPIEGDTERREEGRVPFPPPEEYLVKYHFEDQNLVHAHFAHLLPEVDETEMEGDGGYG